MRRSLLFLMLIVLVLAGCKGDNDNTSSDANGDTDNALGPFDWNRTADAIVVRLDSQPDQESPAFRLNNIPPCTVWGDGRVVWVNETGSSAEEVLEARIEDDKIRAFLEDIINRGFYDWEDELIPPSTGNPVVETITVSLYNDVRTVRRFSIWPQSAYTHILENCRLLSESPVLVMPEAGWVSAYQVPRDPSMPNWLWPPDASFTLQELAENSQARWLEGPLATELWLSAREERGDAQILERNGNAYQVAIVVPGYSRDAALPPDDTQTPAQ